MAYYRTLLEQDRTESALGDTDSVVETELTIPSQQNQSRVLLAALAGDGEAFEQLVRPNLGWALATATLVTGSSADAADAVQDALVAAWRGLGSIRNPDSFSAWFRTLVVRSALK